MKRWRLTHSRLAATTHPMDREAQEAGRASQRPGRGHLLRRLGGAVAMVGTMAGAMAAGGCVSVQAPDKPIVIELNINIKQEVIYRLAADAGATIDKNPDIF
jgi:hypothetical protein